MAAMHLASWKTKEEEICLNRYGILSMPDFESKLSSKIKTLNKKNIIKHNTGSITSPITKHIKTTILCNVCFIATTMTTKENPAVSLFTWRIFYNHEMCFNAETRRMRCLPCFCFTVSHVTWTQNIKK